MLRENRLGMEIERNEKDDLINFLQDYDPECLNLVEEIFTLEERRVYNHRNNNCDYYDDCWQDQKDGIFD